MMDLQELITRGRFIFSKAPERLTVFGLVNGKRNTAQIAGSAQRHVNNIRRDLQRLHDAGLIQPKVDKEGKALRVHDFPVYEKVPLARAVPAAYFKGSTRLFSPSRAQRPKGGTGQTTVPRKPKPLHVPKESEILDICRHGEDQIYEFKGQGTDVKKLTREIAAMLNARQGGMIFYGVDDAGTIQGTDISRQKLDQPLQNSLKDTVSPAATIKLHSVSVIGHEILVIIVSPWNKRDVYHYDGRVLLRKGTNVFVAKPEESRRLHRGEYVT